MMHTSWGRSFCNHDTFPIIPSYCFHKSPRHGGVFDIPIYCACTCDKWSARLTLVCVCSCLIHWVWEFCFTHRPGSQDFPGPGKRCHTSFKGKLPPNVHDLEYGGQKPGPAPQWNKTKLIPASDKDVAAHSRFPYRQIIECFNNESFNNWADISQ